MTTAPAHQQPHTPTLGEWQPLPKPGPTTPTKTPRKERFALTKAQKRTITCVTIGVVFIAAIGFAGSYHAVTALAERKGFGDFARFFTLGVDIGIAVFLGLDLLLAWLRMPFPLLRQTGWLLTAATVVFNAATAWPDKLGAAMHGVIPILFIGSVEAARHAIARAADITADRYIENPPLIRWIVAPLSTFYIWRRMRKWNITSYAEAIRHQQQVKIYKAGLRKEYGKVRYAPADKRLVLTLAGYGMSIAEAIDLPRREAAARAEEEHRAEMAARKAEEARRLEEEAARAEQARIRAEAEAERRRIEEETRLAEAKAAAERQRIEEEARLAAMKAQAEADRIAAKAEADRLIEMARVKAEERRLAEEARLRAEAEARARREAEERRRRAATATATAATPSATRAATTATGGATPATPSTTRSATAATPPATTATAATPRPDRHATPVAATKPATDGAAPYRPGTPQHVVYTLWRQLGHRPTGPQIVSALGEQGLPNSQQQARKIRAQVERERDDLPGPKAA